MSIALTARQAFIADLVEVYFDVTEHSVSIFFRDEAEVLTGEVLLWVEDIDPDVIEVQVSHRDEYKLYRKQAGRWFEVRRKGGLKS
jgi:hypothetical protein